MYGKLPNLTGKSVLCVGCGSGEECEYISKQGAEKVVGIDISDKFVQIAKNSYPNLDFLVRDIEQLDFPDQSVDFVYSSLVMPHLGEWTKALENIHRVLKDNGTFLFSTHHPIKWAAQVEKDLEKSSYKMGYLKYKKGQDYKIYGDYLNTRELSDTWFGEIEVTFYSRPISVLMKDIRDSGFEIVDFLEPKAIQEAKENHPDFYEIHQKIPMFIIFELRKNKT